MSKSVNGIGKGLSNTGRGRGEATGKGFGVALSGREVVVVVING